MRIIPRKTVDCRPARRMTKKLESPFPGGQRRVTIHAIRSSLVCNNSRTESETPHYLSCAVVDRFFARERS